MQSNLKEQILTNDDYLLDLLVRMAYHSTAIEGNTLSQAQTSSIILNSYIPSQMSEREFYEVKNYKAFMPFMTESLKNNKKLDLVLIKEFHKIIMENLLDNNGLFKNTQNTILGAEFETALPYMIPSTMQDWCDNLYYRLENSENNDDKVKTILEQHINFEKIHPFSDGNGRIGRLLIVYSCIEQSILPIVIPVQSKNEYISYLNAHLIDEFASFGKKLQRTESQRIENINNKNKHIIRKTNERER